MDSLVECSAGDDDDDNDDNSIYLRVDWTTQVPIKASTETQIQHEKQ
jgi:hypothetical protein